MDPRPDPPEPSLRSLRTAERLRAIALERFVEDGFDQVTAADIAALAGMTERTFFRHFASKEDVLFGDFHRQLEWLPKALRERPPDEDLVDAVGAAIWLFPDDPRLLIELAKRRESLLGRDRVARYLRDVQGSVAEIIRLAALDRTGTSELPSLVLIAWSEMIAAALFAAVNAWYEEDDRWELGRLAELTVGALVLVPRLDALKVVIAAEERRLAPAGTRHFRTDTPT